MCLPGGNCSCFLLDTHGDISSMVGQINQHKREKIQGHLRNGYFVAVNKFVMMTIELYPIRHWGHGVQRHCQQYF
jgi:hypothetical protein